MWKIRENNLLLIYLKGIGGEEVKRKNMVQVI